ncbi:hypothetical protein ELI64_26010 [Klebsiella pneumoniae]|uniref:Uncharacterized protein n=4 Tax=Klebsiella TaxID=570 RepID=A0AAI9E2F0_KLEOX|nr:MULTISPECIES: hypothetical protein [Enterobacteriaceae]ARV43035.1 hypothetical protein RJA_28250 [Klebsiella pneumoniae subsp. pneumoniae]ASG37031.1 hypothetical protein CES89_26850 [Klebsiella pneumoniae]AVO80638.1 hypothetical protein AM459_26210 [Klebsiella pneumoniae]AWD06582.1 hypothetical protein AM407_27255 [Klebsiella aerogenes]ELI6115240.1 hypothetical protein [Klebsiella pneumoniae]
MSKSVDQKSRIYPSVGFFIVTLIPCIMGLALYFMAPYILSAEDLAFVENLPLLALSLFLLFAAVSGVLSGALQHAKLLKTAKKK